MRDPVAGHWKNRRLGMFDPWKKHESDALAPHMKRRIARQAGVVRLIGSLLAFSLAILLSLSPHFLPDRKGKAELLDLHLGGKLGGDIGGEAGGDLDDDDLGGVHPRVVYQPGRPVINSVDKV